MINKKPLIEAKIGEFSKAFDDYSFCDIIFAALNTKYQGIQFKKEDILGISDEEFYTMVSKAFEKERKFLK